MNNFHTHTLRCHHATGTDREYVIKAINQGYKIFGFADHTPWPYTSFQSTVRMDVTELNNYVNSIKSLRAEFQGEIDLRVGLECEGFKQFFPWLKEKKEELGIDYLILGHHFIKGEEDGIKSERIVSKDNLLIYLDEVEEAISTGLFSYIAHPDILFSSYKQFDSDCEFASYRMCTLAKKYDFPLEYNLLGLHKQDNGYFSGMGFPNKYFWEIVKEEGVKAIVGVDAHTLEQVDGDLTKREINKLTIEGFNLVDTI